MENCYAGSVPLQTLTCCCYGDQSLVVITRIPTVYVYEKQKSIASSDACVYRDKSPVMAEHPGTEIISPHVLRHFYLVLELRVDLRCWV